MQESEYFTQEFTLDINYPSRFVQYPHYPIACCLPHLSTVAHNCHGKSINLMAKRKRLAAKRITSQCGKKKKTCGKKKNLTAKRKKTQSKKKTSRQKEKDSKQKENLTAKRKRLMAKFLRYREDILILISFAVRSWFEILFPKILDFSTCGYS